MEEDPPRQGEIIFPEQVEDDDLSREIPSILTLVKDYTDRPDLFLAEVERHDPGFIKRMNKSATVHSERLRQGKFKFGERRAYTSLGIQALAALTVFGLLAYLVVTDTGGFWKYIDLIIFYAVAQSGMSGFSRVVSAISGAIGRRRSNDEQK